MAFEHLDPQRIVAEDNDLLVPEPAARQGAVACFAGQPVGQAGYFHGEPGLGPGGLLRRTAPRHLAGEGAEAVGVEVGRRH